MGCHALVEMAAVAAVAEVVVVRALQLTVLCSQHSNICTMWLGSKVYQLLVLYSRQSPSAPSTSHVTSPHTLCSIRSLPPPSHRLLLKRPVSFKNYYLCLLWPEARKLKELATSLAGCVGVVGRHWRKRLLRIEEKCNEERKKKLLWEELEMMKRQKFNINDKKSERCVQERKHERKRKLLMKMLRTSRS